MGIKVQHGGSLGDAGKILAQGVHRDLDRSQRRKLTLAKIKSQAQQNAARLQMQYNIAHEANQTALEQAAIEAGVAKDLQREQFMQEFRLTREQARQKAKQTEFKYTTQQRIEDAKLARAENLVKGADDIPQEQKDEMLRRLAVARAGIEPTAVLGDPNKPQFDEGKEPGKLWPGDPGGGWEKGYFSTNPETGEADLEVRPDQTPQYLEKKHEFELARVEKQNELKLKESMAEMRMKLLTESIDQGVDKPPRHRTKEEVDEIVNQAYGIESQSQQQGGQDWTQGLRELGIEVRPEDMELGAEVGGSVAFLRQFETLEDVPPQLRAAYEAAARVVAKAAGKQPVMPAKNKGRRVSEEEMEFTNRLHGAMSSAHSFGF
jgi:hypothetical protein